MCRERISGKPEPNLARPNHLRLLQFATTNPTNPTPTSVPVMVRWGTGIANSCRRASGGLVEESWSWARAELSSVTACCAGAEKSINSPMARQYVNLCIVTLVKILPCWTNSSLTVTSVNNVQLSNFILGATTREPSFSCSLPSNLQLLTLQPGSLWFSPQPCMRTIQ